MQRGGLGQLMLLLLLLVGGCDEVVSGTALKSCAVQTACMVTVRQSSAQIGRA